MSKTIGIFLAGLVVLSIGIIGYLMSKGEGEKTAPPQTPETIRATVTPPAVIDYDKLEKDQALKTLMSKRKAQYGIDKGIDFIVQSNESIQIGGSTVVMQEVLDKIRLTSGKIMEENIDADGHNGKDPIHVFGIHVVQPGDNIWNIHFQLLRDYFDHKGLPLSPLADEPNTRGYSSGVGKLLKFSEHLVYIYNIKEKQLAEDIHLIRPLNKIIVYNMDQIFSLLDQIDYAQVDRIQFDGDTLWMPSAQ